jgi:hypothetical protein
VIFVFALEDVMSSLRVNLGVISELNPAFG